MSQSIDVTTQESVNISIEQIEGSAVTVSEQPLQEITIESTEHTIAIETSDAIEISIESISPKDVVVTAVEHPFITVGGANGAGDVYYVFNQDFPSSVWTVVHNLNKKPSITVVSSADNVVYGSFTYISNNKLTITFSAAFSGKAYLN